MSDTQVYKINYYVQSSIYLRYTTTIYYLLTEPCNTIGELCFCSQKPNACSGLSNSICDTTTDTCECIEDFYVSPQAPGVCTAAPGK